ncbi:MAG: CDF family Co(II)/Ni(II) efflux transporter DmeF [Roseofilum sp. SBFL]|uniref:CDF family Co(II)/Ni(II) efflux transporter DmeF n=1 Tax=unclassified Roseofilum TaxID=2620099 RepID=UPI001AFD2E04|nr:MULTISPECIES: CDF family Co(II)/Ni(II) efflux transporter DmeF [unclassified Roseofilum]MBP0012296.1 CDF family Co(II)/Ni(II) efflux transporter DmeF [Roseofilum sp. SID3]MBP0024117.1 CDF family Co(II)/Ni(II) efflux transporter DmeF [Roseofilum sp. SID2]MBP0039603.1 CDF family Co(II)/Ni(II) efflux transporter DmeF [Roseofilum sp. SID1]MBP0042989.1 CDF family Co(II)/Ni(II) efflux transporter DmeF [Roseofilum sp. SBFL]
MHIHHLEEWQHSHDFLVDRHSAERKTQIVTALTLVTMIGEIVAGTIFGSMALLADGWHMATHLAAFGITLFAYQYARSHANNPRYTFGTGKVSTLGGFASAVALAVVACVMVVESIGRLLQPEAIQFNEAIIVAVIGLVVNLVSALLLEDHHDHAHEHHDREHHEHHDHNLRAAYFHVLADALTSILAILALFAGKFLGWIWMDAAMGAIGAMVISKWSYNLLRETSAVLLDGAIDKKTKLDIIHQIEQDADNRVVDLHVWYLSEDHLAATISLVTHYPQKPEYYKTLLAPISALSHVLVEVNPCKGEPCMEVASSKP